MTTSRFIANPSPSDMPRVADVVIIGGGPAGTAALWAIERFAPGTQTVLIEKSERLGAGSSLASLENYRTCWPPVCLAQMMRRSVEIFHNADEYLGEGASQSLALKEQGYLFCAFTPAQTKTLQQDVEHLHKIGLTHIEYLDADEVAYRFGWLGNRVIGVKYDPIAGWLDSNALIYRYAQSAKSAKILLGIGHTEICVQRGKVAGVKTPTGEIVAPIVIIAAGANAITVGRTAGVELPVVMRPRQSFTTPTRHSAFPDDAPMIIGASPYPHVRPEACSGAIFGWEYGWNTKRIQQDKGDGSHNFLVDPVFPLDPLRDPRFPSITLLMLARQFGHADGEGFVNPGYLRGIQHNIGYYVSRSSDVAYRETETGERIPYESERAIIDAMPGIEGLFVSIAHVGHGIMSSPAAGEIIAARVLGRDLPDPIFAQFGFDAHWVEHDENAL
jgi:glycine/D-amino acid oxidase-like deaminating enzyme